VEVYESGKVDGCDPMRQFFLITLPFLKEAIIFATLMRAIYAKLILSPDLP
jgi:multiple sugar transport system permease protein